MKWSYHDCVRYISKDQDRITKSTSNWFWLFMNNCKKKKKPLRASQWLMTITWAYIQGIPKMTFLFTKLKISDFSWKNIGAGTIVAQEKGPQKPPWIQTGERYRNMWPPDQMLQGWMAYEVSSAMRFPQCRWRTFWYFLQCVKISAKPYNF